MRATSLSLLLLAFADGSLTSEELEAMRGKLVALDTERIGLHEPLLNFQLFLPTLWRAPAVRTVIHAKGKGDSMPHTSLRRAPLTVGYPVLVFLHGRGESGGYEITNKQSLPSLLLTNATFASTFRFIVVAPQCPDSCRADNAWSADVLHALTTTLHRWVLPALHGDPERVYLAGQSMGGNGAWMYAAQQPRLFAAVVPICGYVQPGLEKEVATRLARNELPVLICHSADDSVIDVSASDQMHGALVAAKASPLRYVRYDHAPPPPMSEFSDLVGHGAYELIFRDASLYAWLLQHRCERCDRPPREWHPLGPTS